jgi:hypothetical protein
MNSFYRLSAIAGGSWDAASQPSRLADIERDLPIYSIPVPHPEGLPVCFAANRFAIIKIIADSLSGGDNRS